MSTGTLRMFERTRIAVALAAAFFAGAGAYAQQPEVSYTDDFQSYGTQANPPGWIDTSIGKPRPQAEGLYKTWPDPLQSANIVYGTKQSSGKPEGANPRIGTFSTYTTKTFYASDHIEYRGRILRTEEDGRIGVTILSSYPEQDRYYLIGLWSSPGSSTLTMQLFGFGAGTITGTTNSNFTCPPNKWVRFLITADDADNATKIKARFWLDGTTEPQTFSIDAVDATPTRLKTGRIGFWAANKGASYVDDIAAKSATDHDGPTISFFESNVALPANTETRYARIVRVDVRASDPNGVTSLNVTLDGQQYTPLTPIDTEGTHTIAARAIDSLGNAGESQTKVFLDLSAPVVVMTESGQPLLTGTAVQRNLRPEIVVTDASATTIAATLNGARFDSGTEITIEGRYELTGTVKDAFDRSTTIAPIVFFIDRTPPVVTLMEGANALVSGSFFDRDVTARAAAVDTTTTTNTATLNGQTYTLGTPIQAPGTYTLAVRVTDAVSLFTDVPPVTFTIDKTAPAISFNDVANGAVLGTRELVVNGFADDAVSVKINGVEAVLDAAKREFTSSPVQLIEGDNTIVAVGVDRAGNVSTVSIVVRLDTRAPELTVTAPKANTCLNVTELQVSGTASDSTLKHVKVSACGTDTPVCAPVDATITAGAFTATIPIAVEGGIVVRIEALDTTGHLSTAIVPVTIDRTKPLVEVSENGHPFTATLLNRAVSLFIRATDADRGATVTATLDGQPYASGAVISGEGVHELKATARDCAGHTSDEVLVRFTIDRVAPSLVSIAPANAGSVATKSAVTGVLSEPSTVVEQRTGREAVVTGTSFVFENLLEEGTNVFSFLVRDLAGNESRIAYTVTVDTTAPSVEIVENGLPIATDALFGRAVTPVIRASDPSTSSGQVSATTITATLNGASFTSGTTITADGSYTLTAKSRDAQGNESATVTATFRIDRTAPAITITAPAEGAVIAASTVEVRGSVTGGDIAAVTVNGSAATITGTSYALTIPLDLGPNGITAVATDRAGNAATTTREISRDRGTAGLVLTSPPDRLLTNRPTIVVAGQVLTPSPTGSVTINGQSVPVDPVGLFRRTDFPVAEGENTITATLASSAGATTSLTVTVTADFHPPALEVLANGTRLTDGARFATAPALALQGDPATTTLTVDGEAVSPGVPSMANGGHTLTAIARDAAGNETRIDRVFFVGDAGSASGCSFSDIEPPSSSAVFDQTIRITGRSGGAVSVLINGIAASVADGSFCGDATLAPGRNEVKIQCADASGQPTAETPFTLVVDRYGDPEVTITAGTVVANKVTVTGTVSAGVVSGDVNGIPFAMPACGTPVCAFTVPDVPVAPGLNVLIARAKTSSSRVATASTHVRVGGGTPQIGITSPLPGTETGASTIDVSGTWRNIDPSSLAVTVGTATFPVTVTSLNDTTGTFVASNVPLSSGIVTTIRVGTAQVDVRNNVGSPSISITSPADNAHFASTSTGALTVAGTIAADEGSRVQVNGVEATVSGNTFSAAVDIHASASGNTPVIARVIAPDGDQASDAIRVVRLLAPLAMKSSFPAADANGVDPGVAVVVLFTSNIDKASAGALRVTDAAGAEVAGEMYVDRDAITFAPAQPLKSGQRYTVSIAASLKDASGATMAAPVTFGFNAAATASATAPVLDETTLIGCFSGTTITGRIATPGGRVRLDVDGVTTTTTASETGAFKFTFTFDGQAGYHLVRVREVGTDGSLSPERALCFRLSCSVPHVVSASLDRSAKTLTIRFDRAMDVASIVAGPGGTILVVPDGETALTGTVALSNETATITFTSIPQKTIALTVKKSVKDASGATMSADFTQTFVYSTDPTAANGNGYLRGAVYDATNGRPLEGASVSILNSQFSILNSGGGYVASVKEGAYTLMATAPGYTTVWRQIVVPAGAGVVPIDIRLTKRGAGQITSGVALTLSHGGDTTITKPAQLTLASASLPAGKHVRLTSAGAQSLAGLLPLGWSPLAAAEIVVDDSTTLVAIPAAKLTFTIDANAVTAAAQTLSLVQYDSERDEWRVVVPVANIANDVTFDITSSGNYTLVYPDKNLSLVARAGGPLPAAPNPCAASPDVCRVTSRSFDLNPRAVLPSGRSVATLTTDGTPALSGAEGKPYPSGTAVQAFIDEELNLADGRVLVDPPFATDLLLYRTLAGDAAIADFHLSPSARATGVILRDGVDRIRIVDYPGRIDRGTLIGAEGGRVPSDSTVTIDIPAGATTEPLHASAASMPAEDLEALGPMIPGFRVAGGFTLTLTRSTTPQLPDGIALSGVELLVPARATMSVAASPSDAVILAEVLNTTSFGTLVHLTALTSTSTSVDIPGMRVVTTRQIVSTELPLDGIVRPGRYLLLVADAPIAYAYGQVGSASGVAAANARVSAPPLGVRDLTRVDGLFVVPIPSKPAAPFTLVPRSSAIGDGLTYTAAAAPDAGTFVNVGVITLSAQPPKLVSVTPANGAQPAAAEVAVIQATFDVAIDPASIASGMRLTNLNTSANVSGTISMNGATGVRFTPAEALRPGTHYAIAILPTIRSASGAAFANTVTSQFTTRPGNAVIRPERIRITFPDAGGKCTIIGANGAIPGNAIAFLTRRNRSFIESYQTTANLDGAFTFDAGHLHVSDRIEADDILDLEILDGVSRAVIGIIELTHFSTNDGRGVYARSDRETKFTSVDGIRVVVPAGAFDATTLITLATSAKSEFARVPNFDNELGYGTSVEVKFEGVASKPIELEMPVPATLDPSNKDWFLGYLGDSSRGPRVAMTDALYVENGMFKTGFPPVPTGAKRVVTNAGVIGRELVDYLAKIRRSGIYAAVDLSFNGMNLVPAGFFQAGYDLFWNTLESMYAPHFHSVDTRGRTLIAVARNQPFTIIGVDAGTGLEAFRKAYDPITSGDSGIVIIPNPETDRIGPYPVFATPFRIESLSVEVENEPLRSISGFTVKLANGSISAETTLPGNVAVTLFNPTKGAIDGSSDGGLSVPGSVGDQLLFFIEEKDVDPNTPVSVVFSEPLQLPDAPPETSVAAIETYLREFIAVETRRAGESEFLPITGALRLTVDSGGRRVLIGTPASLTRGNEYRIRVKPGLADRSGLVIGQIRDINGSVQGPGLNEPIDLRLTVRAPGGKLGSFDLPDGAAIRDQALNGNVLFLAAVDGGIAAYDVADPAAMNADTKPLAIVPGPATPASPGVTPGVNTYLGIATDHHGRVFATGNGSLFGFVQSFRLEDFLNAGGLAVTPRAGASVSWVIGASAAMGIESRVIAGDRPEAIPRKIQLVVQDDETSYNSRQHFKDGTSATVTSAVGEHEVLSADLATESEYANQRITVENLTLDLRWSGDATRTSPARITGIIAREGDRLRVLRNRVTYGVISLFGYGVGVFDLNAVESNDWPGTVERLREAVRLTDGMLPHPLDSRLGPDGVPFSECGQLDPTAIQNLTFAPDAMILPDGDSPTLRVFAVNTQSGVLDLSILTPSLDGEADSARCDERAPLGLRFHHKYFVGHQPERYDDPRLAKLRDLFIASAGQAPFARFNGASYYSWRLEAKDNRPTTAAKVEPALGARGSVPGTSVTRDYMLVPGNEYGLLVVNVGGTPPVTGEASYAPLTQFHLADVIWIPGGAYAVRAIPRSNLATVIDRDGYVLLVDLARIDERWDANGLIPPDALFPTAAGVLASGLHTPDPRIVWKSDERLASGTLAPIIDPDTGFVFVGKMLQKTVNAVAAIDPRIQIKADVGAPNGLSEVGGVVPLGIDPPANVLRCDPITEGCNASLGAFRLELSLPGAMSDSLSATAGKFFVALESERVFGAAMEQTSAPLPPSHLRQRSRGDDGDPRADARFAFERTVPEQLARANRHQRGFNKWISPWVVAIADPRASEKYAWPTQTPPPSDATKAANRAAEGCHSCMRPKSLRDKSEAEGVFELYTTGRLIAARPEHASFTGTGYEYLANAARLTARFATVMADTVRPPAVLVAAQNPPVAGGLLQETTYLHSGELETSSLDLDAGGRAGWNAVFDRTYRSRTIGGTVLGAGWESSILRRLRELPNGNVEYRDGAGELWLFKLDKNTGKFTRPRGLFLNLARTDRGFLLVSQKKRMTAFDSLGRLIHEADEFAPNPYAVDEGNIVRYLYDETGRLARVIDPLGRASNLNYYAENAGGGKAGHLASVEDWRGRVVDYDYDGEGRLISASLPVVTGVPRSTTRYGYEAATSYNDALELAPNLERITDPIGSGPRVTFDYGTGLDRDRVRQQDWQTGEKGTFAYGDSSATVTDALKQQRQYALTAKANDGHVDRPHIQTLEETNVETSTWTFGSLPASVTANVVPRAAQSRRFSFGYEPEGMMRTATLAGVRTTTYVWKPAEGSIPGFLLESQTTAADSGAAARSASTNSLGAPLTRTFGYDGAFVKSFQATQGGLPSAFINIPFVRAKSLTGSATNDAITESIEVDRYGRPKTTKGSGGTDTDGERTEATLSYADGGAKHELGLLTSVNRGGLVSTIKYPEPNRIVETDAAKVETTTELDEWLRPKRTFTASASLRMDESMTYDENGRVREVKRMQGGSPVTATIDYDEVGRVKKTSSDKVAVGETLGTIESTIDYDIPNRTITRTLPSGAVVTELLDGLGRVKTRTTTTGTGVIKEELAYDLAGNLVYSANDHVARGAAFDVHGRATMTLAPIGTKTVSEYDAMGQPVNVQRLDANGTLISQTNPSFTPSGRLQSMSTKVDETRTRRTETRWDGGGRSTLVATEGRASHQRFDLKGLLTFSKSGGGTIAGLTNTFDTFHASRYEGMLLKEAAVTEKDALPVAMSYGHDELANPISLTVGPLEWKSKVDESGNVTSSTPPARGETKLDYDARGNVTAEHQPETVNPIRHGYDASGAASGYRDQSDEVTSTQTDRLGRPLVRTYVDGTSETFTYDGSRLASITDRQRRMFSYVYKADTGQLLELRAGGGELLEKYGYDAAGRLESWTTRDAELRYENFDLEGRPRRTKQLRFVDGSGFTNKTVLNEFAQEHEWNVHGERSAWTMPLPTGFAAGGWTSRVEEDHDEVGNLQEMRRTLTGETTPRVLLSAEHRNAGRPTERAVTTTTGAPIVRTYGYNAETGQLNDMTVTARGIVVAGSGITYDGEQVGAARLHGVSNEARANEYSYDDRGRLKTSKAARTKSDAGPATEMVSASDFRKQLDRTVLPGLVFTEKTGHKIANVTRGETTRTFSYGDGAERVDDGRFVYEFDARGRLTKATEKPQGSSLSVRRIVYVYAASDRVIGRRAEYAPLPAPNTPPSDGVWKLEDRSEVLGDEGLPAETTFVWDPITDTLVTVAGANGGVLRQFIHGGAGYDDPIEVAVSENGVAHRLYPVFDEAGAGTLQAILNQKGELVSRTVEEGAYGEDEYGLAGAAVDRVALTATKTPSGQLESVTVSIRTTEQLALATVASGGRLSVLDGTGAVVRSATTTPQLFENYTLRWTLSSEEWTALTSPEGNATQLSIAVTNTLRASAWDGDRPVLPAPDTTSLFTSPGLPAESRESLAEITAWLAASSPEENALFEATSLSALAGRTTPAARLILSAGFQALPFNEPATGLIFVRARWYDPSTGTFLTPDPLGYVDSSNLYAFAGGDPVNGRDPTGERSDLSDDRQEIARRNAARRQAALKQQQQGPGSISPVPPGRPLVGLPLYVVDAMALNAFSHEHANWNPLNPDEPTQGSRDLRAAKKKYWPLILAGEAGSALRTPGTALKVTGVVLAGFGAYENANAAAGQYQVLQNEEALNPEGKHVLSELHRMTGEAESALDAGTGGTPEALQYGKYKDKWFSFFFRGRAIQAETEQLLAAAAQSDPVLREVRIRPSIGGLIPDFVFDQGGQELIVDITSPRKPSILKALKYSRTGKEILAEIYHLGRGLK